MDKRPEIEELTGTFLKAMKLSLEMDVTEREDSFQVDLHGPDSYLLRERQGSVLEALQLLLAKVAETRLGLDKRVVVDCEGFRQGRDQQLIDLVLSAGHKVRRWFPEVAFHGFLLLPAFGADQDRHDPGLDPLLH